MCSGFFVFTCRSGCGKVCFWFCFWFCGSGTTFDLGLQWCSSSNIISVFMANKKSAIMVNLVNRIVVKSDIQTGLFHHLIPIIVSWKSTHGQYISCHSKSVVCYCIPLWMSTHMHVCGFGLVHPRLAAVILQGHNRSPKCTWYKGHNFAMPQKSPGLCPQLFLGFTQALTFLKGYYRSYILLGRNTINI